MTPEEIEKENAEEMGYEDHLRAEADRHVKIWFFRIWKQTIFGRTLRPITNDID